MRKACFRLYLRSLGTPYALLMVLKHSFLITLGLILSPFLLLGQKFLHDNEILELHQTAQGGIVVTDVERQKWEPVGVDLVPLERDLAGAKGASSRHKVVHGKLRSYLDDDTFHVHAAPDSILAMVELPEGVLVSTGQGPYLFTEGQFKMYYQPGMDFPDSITILSRQGQQLAMIAAEGKLYVYDLDAQLLSVVPGAWFTAMAWDKWGGLWVASGNEVHVQREMISDLGPDLEIGLTGPLTLNYGEASTIPFHTFYAPSAQVVKNYYRLKDSDPWKLCEHSDKVFLGELPAGRYDLQLKSVGINDASTISKPLRIKVSDANWLTQFWPWLAGAFGFLFLIAGWGQMRLRRELQQLSEERDKIRLQYEVKNQKQRVGQLQMNPHFIFNSLNSISGLIALNENRKARKYLNEFSQMMRNVLDGSRSENLTVAEEIKFLTHYLSLEKMSRNDSFEYNISTDLDTENIKLPALILQPFVENAIVHGLKQKKTGGKLQIDFREEKNYLRVTIEDNGIGREAASSFRSEGHDSAAIDIITQRLRTLDKWGQGGIRYEDLYDEQGVANGTRVVVRVVKV